ncbi:MAG TPA: hypothetical protein VGZ00_06315 [Candidatus Baltobacteraceae bacterium]|jgi:hypothetical protein|nr:hypothetical protein [Candidatus Baltobacteraceae bacterium]
MEADTSPSTAPDTPLGMSPTGYWGMDGGSSSNEKVLQCLSREDLQFLANANPDDVSRIMLLLQRAHDVSGIPASTDIRAGATVAWDLGTSIAKGTFPELQVAASQILAERWETKFKEARNIIRKLVHAPVEQHPEDGTFHVGRWVIAVPRGDEFDGQRHLKYLARDSKHLVVLNPDTGDKANSDLPTLKVARNANEFAVFAKELQPTIIERLKAFSHRIEKVSKTYRHFTEAIDGLAKAWDSIPEIWRDRTKKATVGALLAAWTALECSQYGKSIAEPVLKMLNQSVPTSVMQQIVLQPGLDGIESAHRPSSQRLRP